MRLFPLLILAALGIAFVFHLSWLPQPRLGLNWFIPDWIAAWADASSHDSIRTGIPFIFIGILLGEYLLVLGYPRYGWLASWLGLITVVVLAEIGQFFLPYRSFDWWDIVWGSIGAIGGLGISFTRAIITNLLKTLLNKRK